MDSRPELAEDVVSVIEGEIDAMPVRFRALRGLPGGFWWLWVGMLVNRAGTFIEPFFVLYLTGPRHVSISTAGLVLTVWGFGSLVSQPIGGFFADRVGRRATLAMSLTATAIVLMTLAQVRSLVLISVLVLVLGVVADMYRPAASAAVTDLVAEPDRVRAFAIQFWAINLGFSIASTSAGLLLHFGFGILFVLDALTTFAFGMLALAFVPETRPEHPDAETARFLDPMRLLRADRLLLAATLIVLVYATLYAQVGITLPLAIRHSGLHASVYGYVIAINGVLIVLVQPMTLGWMSRMPRRSTLPIGIAIVAIGLAATGLCSTVWEYSASVVVWTLGEILTAGSFQALVASFAPPHMRGRYAGALGLAWGASGLLAPLIGAASFAASPAATWIGCLVIGLASAAGQYWLLGAIERRVTKRAS